MKFNLLQYFPVIILAAAALLLAVSYRQSQTLEDIYLDQVERDLQIRLELLEPDLARNLPGWSPEALQEYCRRTSKQIKARLTVIDAHGVVLADSERMDSWDNHAGRPEVQSALDGRPSRIIRYSDSLNTRMIYLAIPMHCEYGNYVLRASMSINAIDSVLWKARLQMIELGILAAVLTVILSYYLARRFNRPLEDLIRRASAIAAGNLKLRLPVPKRGEVRELALAMSDMAEQLKARIAEITRDKNERDAIFAAMSEGVVVLDAAGKIMECNRAARRMLNLPLPLSGAGIQNEELDFFVESLFRHGRTDELELALPGPGRERQLRVWGTLLKFAEDEAASVLLVISDFTQIRKLENFRRDFIADVSHEIKTPLTVILGAVETLQDGALQEPESAARFMEIITQHASRLNALVQDILSLSNLEQQHLNRQQDFTVVDAAVTIANAVEYCRPRADEKGVVLELNIAGKVLVKADPQLLEQAVVNLVDNAVKYSGSVRPIQISLRPDDGYCRIGVTDFGIGIAAEHLDRLFERFYRVDKARSRKLGGTGLGLAIVKHIVQLHGGEIAVRSVVGSGSTFVIKLPLAAVPAGKN